MPIFLLGGVAMSEMKVSGISMAGAEQGYGPGNQAVSGTVEETRPLASEAQKNDVQSLHEMLKEAREKAQKRRDSLKISKNPSQYGDAAMTAYARLARAKNQGQVAAAAGYARRQIARFQAALRTDSENSDRIKAAIRQLQKAAGRAGKKKRELQKEDLMKIRQRKAELENRRRKAVGLGQELNRRKTMRMIRESGYLRETEVNNRLQAQLAATKMELRAQAQALSAQVKFSPDLAAQSYTAQTGEACAAAVPAGGVDIQV